MTSEEIRAQNCAGIWREKVSKNCNSMLRSLPVRILWSWESHRIKSGVIEQQEAEQPKRWSTKQLDEGLNVTEKELACFQYDNLNTKMCIKV